MVSREAARDLVGWRVHVAFTDEGPSVFRLLRAVTPQDVVILAGEGGRESRHALSELQVLEDARLICTTCGDLVNLLHGDEKCADCERAAARERPTPQTTCTEDGCDARAYYSPLAKKFRCREHHMLFRTNTGLSIESEVRRAICRGADQRDERHKWKQIKRSRWRCLVCHANTYERPADWA